MISTISTIEKMTLSLTEEIRIQAPIDVTFAALLEQLGPLNDTPEGQSMSMKIEPWHPVVSNVQYRLSEVDGGTLIKFHHTALGLIQDEHREGVGKGWGHMHTSVRKRAEAAVRAGKAAGR